MLFIIIFGGRMLKLRWMIISGVLMLLSMTTLAQGTCTDLVTRALEKVGNSCTDPISNTICYGNGLIFAQAQPGVSLLFEDSGDTASIEDIASLTHSPLDEAAQIWGVSLMSLRANLPDSLPGQVVQIIVFGNVEVADIQQSAFRFTTGVGTSTCAEAPESGIMVRTPEGVAEVSLTINEIDITMGSTAFIEANLEDGMTVSMLDGSALVTAQGTTFPVSFSQQLNVPLMQDEEQNLIPAGPPSPPQTWDAVKISRAFNVYNTLNQLGTSARVIATNTPAVIESPTPTLTFTPTITFTPAPTLTPIPCTIIATEADVITRVGPGNNRGSFVYLEPNKPIPVTGKKIVDEDIWWQLDKFEVSSAASSVLELWVAEALVTEQGDCESVIDVDAPPIIRIPPTAAPQPTVTPTLGSIPNPNLTPEIVPVVEPYISIEVENNPVKRGECTYVYVDIEFISAGYFGGPGSVSDTTIEGPSWEVQVCPPLSPGSYTYTVDAYSLAGNLTQRSVTISVVR